MSKYAIKFQIDANPDIPKGFWGEKRETDGTMFAENLKDLQTMFLNFLDENDYGAGNLSKANVYNLENKEFSYIGRFSYNGRLWNTDEKEIKI